jgi:hypothetical protein
VGVLHTIDNSSLSAKGMLAAAMAQLAVQQQQDSKVHMAATATP